MKKSAIIWSLFLAGVSLAQLWAQEPSGGTSHIEVYHTLASRDAAYEHGMKFSSPVDEADYWNDQRIFELKLLEQNPAHYMSYLQGKKKSYLKHTKTCAHQCGHGDYYYRQASFYLQYDYRDDGVLLTLVKPESTGFWELYYKDGKHH